MADTIYVKGIRLFPKTDGAPDYVKGSGVITISELVKFFDENPDYMSEYRGELQLKFELLEGRNGLYFKVNTYKKSAEATPPDENNSDLPF